MFSRKVRTRCIKPKAFQPSQAPASHKCGQADTRVFFRFEEDRLHIRDRHGEYMKTGGGRLIISQNGRSTSLKALTLPQYNLTLPCQSKSSKVTECSDSEEQSSGATESTETKVSEESNSDQSYCREASKARMNFKKLGRITIKVRLAQPGVSLC